MTDIARLNQLRALAVEAKEFEENIHKDEVFDKYDEYDTYPNELFQAAFRPAKAIELIDEIDSLRTQLAAAQAEAEALRKDAERYRWMRDRPGWVVAYRIKPKTAIKEWRMLQEGDWWGNWWPTHEQAVDHAMQVDAAMGGQKEQG